MERDNTTYGGLMHKHPHPPKALECWEIEQLERAIEAALQKRKLTREELIDLTLQTLACRFSRAIVERFVDDFLAQNDDVRSEIRYYL